MIRSHVTRLILGTLLFLLAAVPARAQDNTIVTSAISTAGADCSTASACISFAAADPFGNPHASWVIYLNVATSGTFNWEASVDATSSVTGTWFSVTEDVGAASTATADGAYYFSNPGYRRFRLRASALNGTATAVAYRGAIALRASTVITSAAVTNAGTFVVQENGAALTALQVIDNIPALLPAALGAGGGLKIDGSGTAIPISGSVSVSSAVVSGDKTNNTTAVSAITTFVPALNCIGATTAGAQAATAGRLVLPECLLTGELNINISKIGGAAPSTEDPCVRGTKVYVPIDIVTATTTQLVAASASNYNYICGIHLIVSGADNVSFVEDDTAACASPTAGMAGGVTSGEGWVFGANGGLNVGNGYGTVMKTATTNRYSCLITSTTAQVSGTLSYVQAP